ncbi:arabinofuranosidase, partial [candidate division WWE3 bacterium CG_4_8_14_3_um_filter_42_11]
ISLEARNYPGYFLRHQDYRVKLHRNDGSQLFRQDATFCVKAGLADPNAVSLESKNYPGRYLRHRDGHLWVEAGDGSDLYRKDATWRMVAPFWP